MAQSTAAGSVGAVREKKCTRRVAARRAEVVGRIYVDTLGASPLYTDVERKSLQQYMAQLKHRVMVRVYKDRQQIGKPEQGQPVLPVMSCGMYMHPPLVSRRSMEATVAATGLDGAHDRITRVGLRAREFLSMAQTTLCEAALQTPLGPLELDALLERRIVPTFAAQYDAAWTRGMYATFSLRPGRAVQAVLPEQPVDM